MCGVPGDAIQPTGQFLERWGKDEQLSGVELVSMSILTKNGSVFVMRTNFTKRNPTKKICNMRDGFFEAMCEPLKGSKKNEI